MKTLSNTPFSILDVVPVRIDGRVKEALLETVELAQHAERLGYKRIWLAEHHNLEGVASSATAVLIGHVAANTQTIRVGSGGIMLPNHAPLVVAENFGTLETLYPNRIDLGLGRAPGADSLTARALRGERTSDRDDFPELVAEVRSLLGPICPGQQLIATPGSGTNVPMWILGSGLFGARLAAKMGLPFAFAAHFAPRYVGEAIKVYRKQFQPSLAFAKPHVMVTVPLVAAETDEEAAFLATTMQQRTLALIRGQGLCIYPPTHSMAALWSEDEKRGVDDMLAAAIVGGAATVRLRIESLLADTDADELMFSSNFYDANKRLKSFQIVAEVKASASQSEDSPADLRIKQRRAA
jgi:luciferase family oxidoreductase group 1